MAVTMVQTRDAMWAAMMDCWKAAAMGAKMALLMACLLVDRRVAVMVSTMVDLWVSVKACLRAA